MISIGVGSQNPAKIRAVEKLIDTEQLGAAVESVDVPSGVGEQPMSDKETMTGAINRAKRVLEKSDVTFGVGLEGGIMEIEGETFICNWGALVDRSGRLFTGSGARFKLPDLLVIGIKQGRELGDVIDDYTQKLNVKKNEGTVGILTQGLVTRDEMFYHVMKLLYGQYLFYNENADE